jgi:protein-S-isoprenylcysteine O-methyltransferase Ste14
LTPLMVSFGLWGAWVASWAAASIWTRRTAARPSSVDQAAHLIPTIVGAFLIAGGARMRIAAEGAPLGLFRLWETPVEVGWALTGVTALGFAFTWWARIALGSLWSSAVGRKEGHTVVASGPYAIVRHPIYTGLIAALFALALQLGSPISLAGTAVIAVGFWLKARLEERFLSNELGPDAYAAYRARTPMLIPFWPLQS